MKLEPYGEVWVCTDCYFAHHNGMHEHDGQWFTGDSDEPCDRRPLNRIEDFFEVFDYTCSDHESEKVYVRDETGMDWHEGDWTECPHCQRPGWEDDAGSGIQEFSWRQCNGCGSNLGGQRYRLSLWKGAERATT